MTDRILITGGAGFIGSHLIRYLLEHTNYSITSLDRLDDAGSLDRLAALRQRYRERFNHVFHDLRAELPAHLGVERYRYVAHLAAGSHVDRSVRYPLQFVADNVTGTAHLLEYVRAYQPQAKTLLFSTDEVFGAAPEGVTFDEYSSHWPTNPYAASKAGAEVLASAWASTYNMSLVVTHCTNVIGANQAAEKFIPLCINAVKRGELVQIHAAGKKPSTRFYVDVEDVCAAVLAIMERGGIMAGRDTGKYNISGAEELSNLDVAERIASALGKPLIHELVDFVPNRPRHDMRYAIDSTKLERLGWKPRIRFDESLRRILAACG